MGRLIGTKHHDELIRVFARINPSGWKLVLVGGDALKQNKRSELETLIYSLKMQDSIILTGNISDVDSYYLRSKIFAFMSSSEGFPNVIGEALSAGLPIVAFDCIAGPSELIRHEINGLLIELFNYEAFEKGLIRLMQNENFRDKLSSNTMIGLEKFTPEYIGESYMQFILG